MSYWNPFDKYHKIDNLTPPRKKTERRLILLAHLLTGILALTLYFLTKAL